MAIAEHDYVFSDLADNTISIPASGNDRIVVAAFCEEAGSPVTTADVDGNAMTALTAYATGLNQARFWYILDADLPASSGSPTLNTNGGSTTFASIWVLTGADQAAPEDDQGSAVTSTDTTNNDVAASSNAWVLAACSNGNVRTHSWTSPATERGDGTQGTGAASGANKTSVSSGTVNMEVTDDTGSTNRLCLAVVSIAPAGGAPTTSLILPRRPMRTHLVR